MTTWADEFEAQRLAVHARLKDALTAQALADAEAREAQRALWELWSTITGSESYRLRKFGEDMLEIKSGIGGVS